MKTRTPKLVGVWAAGASLLLGIAGCAKLDSGAHAEPSVRVKPAETLVTSTDGGNARAAATAADAGSGSSTGGGEQGGVGAVTGRVVFKGNKPTQGILYLKGTSPKDGQVCAANANLLTEDLIVSDDGGVANVFVFLDKAPVGYKPEKPTEELKFDQKGCVFTTHAFLCQVGQPISVLSDDDIAHNTHTFPDRNDPFNQTIKPKDREGIPLTYKKSEKNPLRVKCDLHFWMIAYHLPLDHPFGAVSGKDGKFEIKNLPAGAHEFRVWHERAEKGKGGFLNRKLKVTVKGGDEPTKIPDIETKPADFEP